MTLLPVGLSIIPPRLGREQANQNGAVNHGSHYHLLIYSITRLRYRHSLHVSAAVKRKGMKERPNIRWKAHEDTGSFLSVCDPFPLHVRLNQEFGFVAKGGRAECLASFLHGYTLTQTWRHLTKYLTRLLGISGNRETQNALTRNTRCIQIQLRLNAYHTICHSISLFLLVSFPGPLQRHLLQTTTPEGQDI